MVLGLLLGVFVYFYSSYIHKNQYKFYAVAVIISVIGFVLGEHNPITTGEFAIGVWFLVMFAGAFSPKNRIGKSLRSVRKELSIFAFITTVPHALTYLLALDLEWLGIAAFVLMIPLTLISFDYIKKKMSHKQWKQIQRVAYIIYLLTWLHVVLVGEVGLTVLFLAYLIKKLQYERSKKTTKREATFAS